MKSRHLQGPFSAGRSSLSSRRSEPARLITAARGAVAFCALLAPVAAGAQIVTTSTRSQFSTTAHQPELIDLGGGVHVVTQITQPGDPCLPIDPCRGLPVTAFVNLSDVSGVGQITGARPSADLVPSMESQIPSALSSSDLSLQSAQAARAMQRDTVLLSEGAVAELRRRAENGDAIAQNNLGYLYASGQSINRDYVATEKWCSAAAAQGSASGLYNLGALYERRMGVGQDYTRAAANYRTAAERGHAPSQARLANLYKYGMGVHQGVAEAMKWYLAAAMQGDSTAQCELGNGYFAGQGVPKDDSKAAKWYAEAAKQGLAAAENNLATLYYRGLGVKTDYVQALYWYYEAAEQGLTGAQNNLGIMYENGRGVERDFTLAARWFRTAAEHGDTQARYNLANLYASGKGVPLDYVSAFFWYSLAASDNGVPALRQLKSISKIMTPRQLQEARLRAANWRPPGKF